MTMPSKKTLSLVVASLSTLVGVLAVLAPFLPEEAKVGIVAVTQTVNYLLLSPVAKLFGVEAVDAK